jgi:hypothetical protein
MSMFTFIPTSQLSLATVPLTKMSPHSEIFTIYPPPPLALISELCKSPSSYIEPSPITISSLT